ncbi:MAG: rhodanese-like domain-containing protein [Candidatus Moraniibacteriota bacterium]
MQNNYSEQKNGNLKALAIGFGLILIIASITLLKSGFIKNPIKANQKTDLDLKARESVDSTKISKITPAELGKKNQADSGAMLIIDLRERADYEKEHLVKSQNIPLSEGFSAFDRLDKNKEYVLFDTQCETIIVNAFADALSAKNFKNIHYLEGGFEAWKKEFGSTISAGDPTSFSDQAKVNFIASVELKKISNQKLTIVDLRKSPEFSSGHLVGAINIPLEELEKRSKEIPFNRKTILYATTGIDAFKGAVRLFDLGFFNVFALSDGLDGWKKQGFEIAN